MTKNKQNLLVAFAVIGVSFLASPALAVNYLSGYSTSGDSYPISFGSTGNYVRNFGGGSVDRRHNAEYQRLAEKAAAESWKKQYYNENPPCGVYGRLPDRCRRGLENVAKRDY